MGRPIVRALCIPEGETKDAEGVEVGNDHVVLILGRGDGDADGYRIVWLTTDHVRVSEYYSVIPGQQPALARLIAHCINAEFERRGPSGWRHLLRTITEDPLVGPVPEAAKVADGEHWWALTGICAVRDDVELPPRLRLMSPWMTDWAAGLLSGLKARIAETLAVAIPVTRTEAIGWGMHQYPMERWDRPDQPPIFIGPEPARLFAGLDVISGVGQTDPVVGLRAGEPVVVVMPCRPPPEDPPPTGGSEET